LQKFHHRVESRGAFTSSRAAEVRRAAVMGDFEPAGTEFAAAIDDDPDAGDKDSGSRSAAGVAAYPTRPPEPVDSRALRGRGLSTNPTTS